MATYTENYNLKKPTYAEPANVMVINENMDKVDEIMHSSQVSLADAYDLNSTYNTGDKVMYEKLMYKCKEDGVTGAWDASKWERTTAVEGSGADLDIYGEASGTAEASFSDGAEASLVECEIGIVPTQDLHGYTKPWAGGAGKNKLEVTASSQYIYTVGSDGEITANGTSNGYGLIIGYVNPNTTTEYILNGCPTGGGDSTYRLDARLTSSPSSPIAGSQDTGNGATFTASEEFYIFLRSPNGAVLNNVVFKPMVRLSTETDATFAPYSNICPISGHTDVTVTVASTSGGSGEDTTVSLGRTVYGGTLDVTTGELTVTKADVNLSQQTLSYTKFTTGTSDRFYVRLSNYISNVMIDGYNDIESDYFDAKMQSTNEVGTIYMENGYLNMNMTQGLFADATAFKTWIESESVHLVYELATPQTFTLTKEQIQTLLGQNYVSHDGGGTISLVYIKKDSTIIPNPTGAEIPLTGIEIDGKKFKIESGGYHKALLWDSGSPTTGASYATDYALLDNLSNYNQIILMVSTNGDRADANHQYSQQVWLDVEYILSSGTWHNVNVAGYGTRYFEASFTDSSFKIIQGGGEGGYLPTIFQIYGVRY